MSDDREPSGMVILEKAGAVIDALEQLGEATARQIADAVDEPVSSTYRLLSSLTGVGWVDTGSRRGRFRLGVLMLRIGSMLEDQIDVRDACRPFLESLRAQTRSTSFLCYRRGGDAVCVDRIAGRDVQSLAMRVADTLPLYLGAAPTTLLAFLPYAEREVLLGNIAADLGPSAKTLPTIEKLRKRLDLARQRGYSVSDEDVTPGIAAVGAPVFNHRGELEAAISISGIRETLLEDLPSAAESVVTHARMASQALGYRGEAVRP